MVHLKQYDIVCSEKNPQKTEDTVHSLKQKSFKK